MSEPTTEAGRALLEDAFPAEALNVLDADDRDGFCRDILAIEAEAAAQSVTLRLSQMPPEMRLAVAKAMLPVLRVWEGDQPSAAEWGIDADGDLALHIGAR